MPPKIYKKPVRDHEHRPKSEEVNDKAELTEKCKPVPYSGDINIRHVVENTHTMERMHTLTSILAGIIAGLFNTNLYSGIFTYMCFHLIMTLLILGSIGNAKKYFLKKADVLSGLGSGVPVFMCAWIIVFNVVYTL